MGVHMKRLACAALAAGFVLSFSGVPVSAQGVSAFSLIMHSAVVARCENRELTNEEAAGTAIGFSSMWKAMRDCRENMAKREAAAAKKR
jgi:hypothetical protein